MRNVEKHLTKEYGGRKLPKRATSLWPSNYVSETDTIPELGPKEANYYQCQIRVLHWMVGHYNISVDVGVTNGDANGRPYGRSVPCLYLPEIKTQFAYGL